MRFLTTILALFITVAFAAAFATSAFAVASGKTIEFADAANGKVTFDGKVHAEKGLKCTDCHTKIFPMKKGPGFKMADINAGKGCGVCHNGEKAFKTSDPKNCTKCHKK